MKLPDLSTNDAANLPDLSGDRSFVEKIAAPFRQVAAGVAEVPAMPWAIANLVTRVPELWGGEALPGNEYTGERTREILDVANSIAGTDKAPQNFMESLNRNLGASLVGVPARVLGGAVPRTVAQNVAEVVTPVTLPLTGGRVAANAAVGTGFEQVLDAVKNDPNYRSIQDVAGVNAAPNMPDLSNSDGAGRSGQLPDLADPSQMPTIFEEGPPIDEENGTLYDMGKYLVGGLALAMGAAGIRAYMKKPLRTSGIETSERAPDELQSFTTHKDVALAETIDPNSGLANMLKRVGDPRAPSFDQLSDNTGAAKYAKITQTLHDGVLPNSTMRMSWKGKDFGYKDVEMLYNNLPQDRRELFSRAMLYQDILDDRSFNRVMLGDPSWRGAASDVDDATMRGVINQAKSDPLYGELTGMYRESIDTVLRYMVGNRISRATYRDMRQRRPNFVPNRALLNEEDLLGRNVATSVRARTDSLTARSTERGGGVQNFQDPIIAGEAYIQQMLDSAITNATKRQIIQSFQMSPEFRAGMKRVAPGKGKPDRTVTVYDNDRMVNYEFADPFVKSLLDFAPLTAKYAWLNTPRRLMQQGMTGLGNPFFAFKSMIYDVQAGSIYREQGRSFGLADWALQSATAGRVSMRGDPTAYLSAFSTVPYDMTVRAMDRLSTNILADLSSRSGLWTAIPEPAARFVADSMRDAVNRSHFTLMNRYGALNTTMQHEQADRISRVLEGWTDNIKSSRFGNAAEATGLAALGRSYKAMFESIQLSGRYAYWIQNAGKIERIKDPVKREAAYRKLAAETRQLGSGDFSRRGMGSQTAVLRDPQSIGESISQKVYKASHYRHLPVAELRDMAIEGVPYANVAIQALARLGRGLRDDPTGVLGGLAMALIVPKLASVSYTTMMGGEYKEFYDNQPSWWRVSNVYMPLPGKPAEEGLVIPITPDFMPIVAAVEAGWSSMFGLYDGSINDPGFSDVREGLANFFGLPVPPIVGAPLALAGFQVGGPGAGYMTPLQQEKLAGGATEQRSISSVMPSNIEAALVSMFGTSAQMLIQSVEAGAYAEREGKDITDTVTQEVGAIADQKLRPLSTMWGAVNKEYGSNRMIDEYYKKTNNLEGIITAWDVVRGEYKGGLSRRQELIGSAPEINPEMLPLITTVGQYASQDPYLSFLSTERNRTRAQIESLQAEFPKTQDQVRQYNMYMRDYKQIMRQLGSRIQQMETRLQVDLSQDMQLFK